MVTPYKYLSVHLNNKLDRTHTTTAADGKTTSVPGCPPEPVEVVWGWRMTAKLLSMLCFYVAAGCTTTSRKCGKSCAVTFVKWSCFERNAAFCWRDSQLSSNLIRHQATVKFGLKISLQQPKTGQISGQTSSKMSKNKWMYKKKQKKPKT